MDATRLLPLPKILEITSTCRAAAYEQIREGAFPPPVKIGRKSVWPAHEVETVVAARVAGASDDRIRALVTKLVADRKRRFEVMMGALPQEAA